MAAKEKKISLGAYRLHLIGDDVDKDVEEETYQDVVYDNDGEPVFALRSPVRISGVRSRVPKLSDGWMALRQRKITQKRFVVIVRYDYPFVIFPASLASDIKELEEFFGVTQRGEGSDVFDDRMLATLTYRLDKGPDEVKGFFKTLREILERYGVEIVHYEITRT